MIVIQRKRNRETGFLIPDGGEILWYGLAAAIPANFEIDSYAADVFVRGAGEGGAGNTPVGSSFEHSHAYSSNTSTQGDHQHATSGKGTTGSASGSQAHYGAANYDAANAGHTHNGTGVGNSGAAGSHSHALSDSEVAEVYPPYKRLYWIRATAEAALPVGGIVMWDGLIANRPAGTSLCNGNGSTPDLRDKFIYSAAEDADVGVTGGAETHTHENSDTGAAGGHSHSVSASLTDGASTKEASGYAGGIYVSPKSHSHSVSGTTDADADHTHTFGDTNPATNLPPYLKLYFVMRTV